MAYNTICTTYAPQSALQKPLRPRKKDLMFLISRPLLKTSTNNTKLLTPICFPLSSVTFFVCFCLLCFCYWRTLISLLIHVLYYLLFQMCDRKHSVDRQGVQTSVHPSRVSGFLQKHRQPVLECKTQHFRRGQMIIFCK